MIRKKETLSDDISVHSFKQPTPVSTQVSKTQTKENKNVPNGNIPIKCKFSIILYLLYLDLFYILQQAIVATNSAVCQLFRETIV